MTARALAERLNEELWISRSTLPEEPGRTLSANVALGDTWSAVDTMPRA